MSDTHDERGGDESAALTVAQYADRYMAYGDGRSDMDPGRPPIEAMWRVRKQLRDLRKQLAAATARAEKAEAEVARLRSLEDSYIVALDQMSIGDVQWLRERAEKAERERDAWRSEAERRSAERNAAVRRIGLVRECLNAPGELLPGLAELLENGAGRALSATETDADGSQGSADGRTPVRVAAGLSGPELPDRQAKLLAVIRRWGGEWAPIRARTVLVEAGYAVTKERAHQIMKHLAERGYLEQVRPRAYTYRLKAEVQQLDDDTTEDGQHG